MTARTDLPRGLVTFVFADVEGAARLVQVLGEAYRPMLTEYRRLLRHVLPSHGAMEVSVVGDSCLFVFPDAAAALRGCLTAQSSLWGPRWPTGLARPKVKMGLHTAQVEPVDGEYVSIEVFRASRLTDVAHGGQVLCSAATAWGVPAPIRDTMLVDLGPHKLRDFGEPVRLFQLVAPGLPRTFSGPRARYHAGHGEISQGSNPLTRAESTVAALVVEGLSNPQIAQRLCISRHTVETHMKHIFAKLAVSSRAGLAARMVSRA
jgi:class 3 adenylate cyclase/DNA-binding CsgD family transcriptional regulator